MTIAYAGIGIEPPPDAQDRVYSYWHGHRIEEFDYPGHYLRWMNHLPVPPPPRQEPPRIGALSWPTGASRWATCHLAATGSQVDALIEEIGDTLSAKTLEFSDGHRTVSADMWLLPPRPIQQRGSGDLYLLTLVDERWWWWLAGNQGVTTSPGSWSSLLTTLFSAVGVGSPTIPGINVAYGAPTAIRWEVGYKPIPLLIDAACACIGFRVVRKLDGSVVVQNYEDADADEESAWETYQNYVLSGGRMDFDEIGKRLPERVTTVFWGYDPKLEGVLLSDLALPAYADVTPVAGRTAQVVADMPAVADPADRADYATRAATDYYGWAFSRSDYTLRGFHPRDPNGNDLLVEWVHRPDQLVTRVLKQQVSDLNVYGDKPPTIRFPALITSTFSASAGYSWTRLTEYLDLAPEVYDPPDGPKTGQYLFEVNDNRDLTPGCRVLMYSNPDGPGWQCQIDVMRRMYCVSDVLVYQESTDGGSTWETVYSTGLPCGSGSGGSGSGSNPNPCQNCFPSAGDGNDVEVVVAVACVGGVTFTVYAKIAIVSDAQSGTVRNEFYDYTWETAGCCECPETGSGSGSGSGSGGIGCDTYTVAGYTLSRDPQYDTPTTSTWVDPGGNYRLSLTVEDVFGLYLWTLCAPDSGPGCNNSTCKWVGPDSWDGTGSAEFTLHDGTQCESTMTVYCGGGTGVECGTGFGEDLPATLNYAVGASGGVACVDGLTGTMTKDCGGGECQFTTDVFDPCGDCSNTVVMHCVGGLISLSAGQTTCGSCPPGGDVSADSVTYGPFSATFTAPACWFTALATASDYVTVVVTE